MTTNATPTNWNKGFSFPHKLMDGENPFSINGKFFLYVWNTEKKDHEVFSYSDDIFLAYSEFQDMLKSVNTKNP